VIADSLDCGTVAAYLKLDLASLGQALVDLEHAQLIARSAHELRLTDLRGLEQLSNEITQ
jgi:hypothetical protein